MPTRDPAYIQSQLYLEGSKVFTKQNIILEIPKRYIDRDLLEIKEHTYVFGVFALRIGDKYSVSLIPCMFKTTPLNIQEYKIGEVEYVQLIYGKNMCVFESNEVVKKGILSYNIFDEYLMQGKIPWFIEYEDIVKILDNMPKFADSNVGGNYIVNEIISSFVTRAKSSRAIFYRSVIASKAELAKKNYVYNGIDDVFYSAPTTLNKLAGNYYNDGVMSALLQPEKTMGKIEKLVRA